MADDRIAHARQQAERSLPPVRATALAGVPELPEIQRKQCRPLERKRER
jgi:hypothetical protein